MTDSPSLAKKLGIIAESSVVVVHSPKGFSFATPPGVVVTRRLRRHADVILAFFHSSETLASELDVLAAAIHPQGSLWISWPKKSSGVTTDLTDQVVRNVVLPRGLVDNKVCAIDATFSALRFVWRRSVRARSEPPSRA